ncbi:hypothetical protein Dsin_026213 [Dipteronia sinensis]|uniref:Uncharacterized protein n=1 Tax=Dipteronia sinensis TaxID=43782 RepID=A0AAD9ZYR0_9ROSI|nr:hypothetical protein Dsin_026213 [Dipteronia sinensis]
MSSIDQQHLSSSWLTSISFLSSCTMVLTSQCIAVLQNLKRLNLSTESNQTAHIVLRGSSFELGFKSDVKYKLS